MKNAFSFTAEMSPVEGHLLLHAVFVPEKILAQLPKKPRIRTKGTMNGVPFALAIQSMKEKGKYLAVNKDLKKKTGVATGGKVNVEFYLVDENELDIPEEMQAALAQDEDAAALFNEFTIGARRSLLHYVSTAKSVDTRIKRSLELLHKIKTRTLYSQRDKD